MEAETTKQDGVALKIWNRVRKALSSNLGLDTTYHDRSVCDFPWSLQVNSESVSRIGHDHFFFISSVIKYHTVRCYKA